MPSNLGATRACGRRAVGGLEHGSRYKFHVDSHRRGYAVDKADPFAFYAEPPPRTASVVWDLAHEWGDADWMADRGTRNALDAPMTIYEMHVGSWRAAEHEHRSLNYRELAEPLARYVNDTGYTHVELMPVMEHPFYGSWGYQTTGYFAPTSRFGTPQDFMYLIDVLHQHGIGVILDWVPSHFPTDEHGLGFFDGTHLYEHADPRKGFHPDWKSLIFNYDRFEVRSFLLSSAHFWLDRYHADGLRVDAVASMLYLDYSRGPGEWVPNEHGGNENLGALRFLKKLNETIYAAFPDVQTFAEESTAWPMVSRPTDMGGLGFGLKWDMGWMHDTLEYFERDPVYRRYAQDELTFRTVYAFTENFTLPLSHDEVVHGKGSLMAKMPGDRWQQLANLRCAAGVPVRPAGQEAAVHGRRPGGRDGVGPRQLPALGAAGSARARRGAAVGGGAQPSGPDRTCAARARLRAGRVRVGRRGRHGRQRAVLPAPPTPARRGARRPGGGQPHARAPPGLLGGCAPRRPLGGAGQQRRARRTEAAAGATSGAWTPSGWPCTVVRTHSLWSFHHSPWFSWTLIRHGHRRPHLTDSGPSGYFLSAGHGTIARFGVVADEHEE